MTGRYVLYPTPELLSSPAGWAFLRASAAAALVVLPGLADEQFDGILRAAVRGKAEPLVQAWSDRHAALASSLGLAPGLVEPEVAELTRHVLGVTMLAGVRPATQARLRALGPLATARIAAAFLGVEAEDLRGAVRTRPLDNTAHYLAAEALAPAPHPDTDAPIRVAAGGLATAPDGGLVLLGGGAAEAAAHLAVALGAAGCVVLRGEPLSTGPAAWARGARPVAALELREARALAALGVEGLSAAAVDVAVAGGIPVFVRAAGGEAALVSDGELPEEARLLHVREGLCLLTAEGAPPLAALLDDAGLEPLYGARSGATEQILLPMEASEELNAALTRRGRATIAGPVTALTVIGRGARTVLTRLGAALEAVGQPRVRLLVLGADDRTLTLVVDGPLGEVVVRALHARLFGASGPRGEPPTG